MSDQSKTVWTPQKPNAQIVALVSAITDRLEPKPMWISEVNELKQDAGPELLLDEIEQQR
jgi:hypothetical protein